MPVIYPGWLPNHRRLNGCWDDGLEQHIEPEPRELQLTRHAGRTRLSDQRI
jgi:hypothetical protein